MTRQKIRPTKSVTLPNSRWAAYATAGAATAIAGISSAEADIHYSGVVNQVFNAALGGTASGMFALDNGATITFKHIRTSTSGGATGGIALFGIGGAAVSNMFRGSATGVYRYPSNLAAGVNIAAGPFVAQNGTNLATLAFLAGFAHSHWLTAGTGFIAFSFNGGSGIEYGWARVTMNEGAPGNSFTLVDFAWADAGTAIVTGQTMSSIPEPGSLGLLAVGAIGLLLWRQRRGKAAA